MTVYCFDTDILAAALLREPPMQLVRRLARTPGDQQCTTAVSVAEIAYAAARNGDPEVTGRIRNLIAEATTVLPFDHELKGQVPYAFVVPKREAALTEDEIKQFALANGPAYQHPRRVFFLAQFPLAGTNKVDREQLRRMVAGAAAAN